MKKVVKCLGCDKPVRFYGSFKVRMTERIKLILTGEIKEQEIVGHLCRKCAFEAGYKVKEYGKQ
jgi:hypothetical protein